MAASAQSNDSFAAELVRVLGFAGALKCAVDRQWYGIIAEIERLRRMGFRG